MTPDHSRKDCLCSERYFVVVLMRVRLSERAGLFVSWKVSQGLMHALALRAGNARPTIPPSFASQMPPPFTQGRLSAAAGISPPVCTERRQPLLVEGAFVGPAFQPRCFAVMVCTSRAKTATRSTASSGNVQSSFPVFCRMISVRAARLSVCVSRKRTRPCPMTER